MSSASKLAASASGTAQEPLKRGVARKFTRSEQRPSPPSEQEAPEQDYTKPDNRIAAIKLGELDEARGGVKGPHPTPPTSPSQGSSDLGMSLPALYKPGYGEGDRKAELTSLETAQVKSPASSGKDKRSTPQKGLSDSESAPAKKPCKRKRADPGQVNFDDDGYSDESDTEEPAAKRRMFHDGRITGLSNLKVACFSNAALQLLYSALSSEDLDLLADGAKVPDVFGIDLEILEHLDGLKHTAEQKRTLKDLRKGIQEAAKSGDLRVSPYVHELFEEMRDAEDQYVSPVLMQQVLAYHKEACHEYDGTTMHDASEYLQLLLNVLFEERPALRELFQFQPETKVHCTGCGHTKFERPEKDAILRLALPSSARCNLKQVLAKREETESNPDRRCSNCEKAGGVQTVERLDSSNMPENLVLQIGRLDMYGQPNKSIVQLDTEEVIVGNKSYRVQAIVKHDCRRADAGHYTAWRRYGRQWWKLDDSISSIMKHELEMMDGPGRKAGYAKLLLLKRNDLEA